MARGAWGIVVCAAQLPISIPRRDRRDADHPLSLTGAPAAASTVVLRLVTTHGSAEGLSVLTVSMKLAMTVPALSELITVVSLNAQPAAS